MVAGDLRYELRGAVEVLSGSRTMFPGVRAEAFNRKSFAVRTYLFDGDEVIVAGVATSAAEGQKYRDAAHRDRDRRCPVIFACASKAPVTGRRGVLLTSRHWSC